MKRIFIVTFVVIITFGLLTLATYEDNAASDALTQIGFPFRFYLRTSARLTDPKYEADFGYFPQYLVYDIIVLMIAIILINIVVAKVMKKKLN